MGGHTGTWLKKAAGLEHSTQGQVQKNYTISRLLAISICYLTIVIIVTIFNLSDYSRSSPVQMRLQYFNKLNATYLYAVWNFCDNKNYGFLELKIDNSNGNIAANFVKL